MYKVGDKVVNTGTKKVGVVCSVDYAFKCIAILWQDRNSVEWYKKDSTVIKKIITKR